MNSEWPVVKLGDYCSKIGSGSTPRGGASVYLDIGEVCLIRSQNIYNDGFRPEGLVYITQDSAEKLKNVVIEHNDILINITGDSVARVCLAEKEYLPARVNQHVAIVRPLVAGFDPRYLRYLLISPTMQSLLLTISAVGATRNALTKNMIETLEVVKPPLDIQFEVANNLESLDKKIQLNRQINQTLESMAQAIFQSWFVDFDPVKAKIAAREQWQTLTNSERTEWLNELLNNLLNAQEFLKACLAELTANNEHTAIETLYLNIAAMKAISSRDEKSLAAMPSDEFAKLYKTASLFPERLVGSELGEIPEGWEVQKLEDSIELSYGKALKKSDRVDGKFPVYGSGGVTGNNNESLVDGPGIIVGRKGTVGSLYWEDQSFFPIDTVFYVKPKPDVTLVYVYYLLQILGLEKMNTDAAVPGLNRNNVYRLVTIKPVSSLITNFSKMVILFRKEIASNQKEIQSLEAVRDSLLPKLLSGELEIQSND